MSKEIQNPDELGRESEKIVEIDDEEVNINFLNEIKEGTQKVIDMRDSEKPKKQRFHFNLSKKKKKKQHVIDISGLEELDVDDEEVVILGSSKKFVKTTTIAALKVASTLLTIGVFSVLVLMTLSYKLILSPVQGSVYTIGNYSIVSNASFPNLNEVRPGTKVMINQKSISPIVYDYKTYIVNSRDGGLIQVTNQQGKNETLESTDISYILK